MVASRGKVEERAALLIAGLMVGAVSVHYKLAL